MGESEKEFLMVEPEKEFLIVEPNGDKGSRSQKRSERSGQSLKGVPYRRASC